MRDKEKALKARDLLNTIIAGKEPYTGNEIHEESFLNDPRMIRCFAYVVNVLTDHIESNHVPSGTKKFYIRDEELTDLKFPDEEIGINGFCKIINESISLGERKKLSGSVINKKLKEMKILSELVDDEGKKTTVITDEAKKLGLSTRTREYNGREYEQIVYGKEGVDFLVNHLQEILTYKVEESA